MATSPNKMFMGLWRVQYAPRERIVKANLDKPTLAIWNKKTVIQKIVLIDKFQAKGYFGKR